MVDKKIVLDWVKNDREIKKECQSILMDAYKFGVLEHSPDGISSVDVSKEMGKDEYWEEYDENDKLTRM